MNIKNQIIKIIDSQEFKDKLTRINQNHFNLKQESFIRNSILEKLNLVFETKSSNYKALAEYPRENKTKTDLSIINVIDDLAPYKVEFKYQFSKDFKIDRDYVNFINRDYDDRNSNMFILIVAHFDIDEKKEYDKKWGIKNGLAKYVSKHNDWESIFDKPFCSFEECSDLMRFQINISEPYKTKYLFYVLSKKVTFHDTMK